MCLLRPLRTNFGALIRLLINSYFEALVAFTAIIGLNIEGKVFYFVCGFGNFFTTIRAVSHYSSISLLCHLEYEYYEHRIHVLNTQYDPELS
jgi:hypothetical protein